MQECDRVGTRKVGNNFCGGINLAASDLISDTASSVNKDSWKPFRIEANYLEEKVEVVADETREFLLRKKKFSEGNWQIKDGAKDIHGIVAEEKHEIVAELQVEILAVEIKNILA